MGTYTVTDELINSQQAADYFTRADRRVMIGLRATMEILGLPCPEYALRRKPGRTPAGDVANAYRADARTRRSTTIAPRRPNAASDVVAAAKAASAERLGGGDLYRETFGG